MIDLAASDLSLLGLENANIPSSRLDFISLPTSQQTADSNE